MTDNDFLDWIYARMVKVHNENELVDYMQKFKDIIKKGKMTETDISRVLIEGDTATIMGVKYQRIIEPQSFYDKLYGLLKPNLDERVDFHDMTIRVLDLIRENIPEPYKGVGLPEYSVGYNDSIREVNENLFK
jgi:hypothetical protein